MRLIKLSKEHINDLKESYLSVGELSLTVFTKNIIINLIPKGKIIFKVIYFEKKNSHRIYGKIFFNEFWAIIFFPIESMGK